jgi:hypothetical protein
MTWSEVIKPILDKYEIGSYNLSGLILDMWYESSMIYYSDLLVTE